MVRRSRLLLNLYWAWKQKHQSSGFTLVELLVAIIMSGVIITGLLAAVVELQSTNNLESARTETQREMQLALDFISSELREAVYVYDGSCLDASINTQASQQICSGIFNTGNNYIPHPANSVPILAFWKIDPLPSVVSTACAANPSATDSSGKNYPCLAARTYGLVVYYLSRDNSANTWQGRSRILRYELSQYDSNGNPVAGYVNPFDPNQTVSAAYWPLSTVSPYNNLQSSSPTDTSKVLVDFVEDRQMFEFLGTNSQVACSDPTNYILTPSNKTLNLYSAPRTDGGPAQFGSGNNDSYNMRNFYACVRIPPDESAAVNGSTSATQTPFNQKVVLFLRGNMSGKPGINTIGQASIDPLPVIETQVLNRGVIDKAPVQ